MPRRGEAEFLAKYQPEAFARPSVAVDLVILTIVDAELRLLLVKRSEHPFKGQWALPGGFVRVGPSAAEQGEDLDEAARRELSEETGLEAGRVTLQQVATFGRAGRDPRTRVISVAYLALIRPDLAPFVKAGGDASHVRWFRVDATEVHALAFDHSDIVALSLERVRAGLESSNLAFDLVPLTFTIPELRHAFAVVLGTPMDPGNFRRKFNRLLDDGIIEQAPGKRITATKPATVFRFVRR